VPLVFVGYGHRTGVHGFPRSCSGVAGLQPPVPSPQPVRSEPNPINLAMEALLRKELSMLGERLSRATMECQTLRSERDELFQVGRGGSPGRACVGGASGQCRGGGQSWGKSG
jgi:hypothetical protein